MGIPEGFPGRIPEEFPGGISEGLPQKFLEEILGGNFERFTEESVPDFPNDSGFSKRNLRRIFGMYLRSISRDILEGFLRGIFERTRVKFSEETSGLISTRTVSSNSRISLKEISAETYEGWNFRRIAGKILEGIPEKIPVSTVARIFK